MTLRRKLLLWYSGVFFFSAAVLVTSMYLVISHKTRSEFFRYFEDEYEEAQRIAREHSGDAAELKRAVEVEVRGKRFFPLSYELYDVEAQQSVLCLAPRWEDRLPALPSVEAVGDGVHVARHSIGDDRGEVIYLRTGWVGRLAFPGLLLRAGMSYERVADRLEKLGRYLLYALVGSVLISFVGGKFLAARSLGPIDEVAHSLERVQAEKLSVRLPEAETQDEVGRIVAAANRMLGRLEDSFDRMSRFAADAAHELRTPLSTLKCRLEVELERADLPDASRQVFEDVLEQANQLAGLVDALLLVARLDASDGLDAPARVNLAAVLEDIADVFEVRAAAADLSFSAEYPPECVVWGDQALLRRLLANLIENAVCYTPPAGDVAVRIDPKQGGWRISVADTGMGVGAADLDSIFDRFYRTERSRSKQTGGMGIGLSICRRIVELHGGSIRIDSTEGAGTTVTADLPADQAPQR